MNKGLLSIFILIISFNLNASDTAKEKRWADQVIDALIDGDEIWLNTGGGQSAEFLGLYTEASEETYYAAIVIHGSGVHPNWQQVVQPLRVGLTEHGWNTLAIQMPILANDAEHAAYAPLFDEVSPRLKAAIQYLKSLDQNKIVIVAHSLGASMAAYHLSRSDSDILGFAAIGMSAGDSDKRMNSALSLRNIKIPTLDLYGSDDLESVLSTVNKRTDAAKKANNKSYKQIKISAANHFFDSKEEVLLDTVRERLTQFTR